MKHLVILSFLFLGVAFYALSGGASFDPKAEASARQEARAIAAEAKRDQSEIEKAQRRAAFLEQRAKAAEDARAADLVQAGSLTPETPQQSTDFDTSSLPLVRASAFNTSDTQTQIPSLENTQGLLLADFSEAGDVPEEVTAIAKDMRAVRATRVNLRQGPGTRYNVLGKLLRGEEVEVLQAPGNGWVKLRVQETGRIGWMSESLLTAKTSG